MTWIEKCLKDPEKETLVKNILNLKLIFVPSTEILHLWMCVTKERRDIYLQHQSVYLQSNPPVCLIGQH